MAVKGGCHKEYCVSLSLLFSILNPQSIFKIQCRYGLRIIGHEF